MMKDVGKATDARLRRLRVSALLLAAAARVTLPTLK